MSTKDLREREKELKCIYRIAEIRDRNAPLFETVQMIVDILPSAWLHPNVACARVMLDGRGLKSKNLGRCCDRQRSDIVVFGEKKGVLEIIYTKKMPRRDEGPFLAAERSLLDAVANRIGKIVERADMEQRLKDSNQRLRDLFGHLESAREGERSRIASEVHDSLGQMLATLKVMAGKLYRSERNVDGTLRDKLKLICGLVDSSLDSTHDIVSKLRPPLLEHLGLAASIKRYLKEFQEHSGIKCSVDLRARSFVLDQERSTGLFRILQGLLSNIVRHAHATKVSVGLRRSGRHLLLSARDNGRGFSTEEKLGHGSYGIQSIRERMRYWGGQFEIETTPGRGCSVTVKMPIQNIGARS